MAEQTVVFISGTSSGIGKALAEHYLSKPNHTVIGSVRDDTTPSVAELKSFKPASGSSLLLVHIESTSPDDPAKALVAIEAAGVKHIDIVYANAGGSPPVLPMDDVPVKDLLSSFQTNAVGPFVLFQTLKPLLQKSKAPKWAAISSISGSIGMMGTLGTHITVAYGASKAALNWLTRAIHCSQPWLITVAFHPGLVQTGPGNWIARKIGMEQAPTTIDESVSNLVKKLEEATRDNYSGKFINAIDGNEIPW
ncbi:Norsolorinic acid ketoreductase [Lachnellula occidentalis]|uniref:Norsolorinic acid ketoreductase n=1 Tax=Lachnellula occidentalis TaxID=215460 RepID=A0A8H8UGC6_9HELO|nr:Norsolorinic acid ketoreductase [Lachnellula occidentalis]